jgi:hypothetical protein
MPSNRAPHSPRPSARPSLSHSRVPESWCSVKVDTHMTKPDPSCRSHPPAAFAQPATANAQPTSRLSVSLSLSPQMMQWSMGIEIVSLSLSLSSSTESSHRLNHSHSFFPPFSLIYIYCDFVGLNHNQTVQLLF